MTPAIREQAQRWVALLRSTAGMFASSTMAPQAPLAATPLLHLDSDAALEGAAVPGLGGYMHGFYWAVPLQGDELLLPISVLELIAIGVNLITFGELAMGTRVALCSDSLNSVQVLTNLRAKSPLMAHVHLRILELPQAKSLVGPTSAVHCFGSANPLADAVSRGNLEYFRVLCAQLGVAPVEMQVPLCGRQLLDEAVEYARANGLLKSDVPVREKRSASQLAMEHHFGSEFSSDEDSDGPSRSFNVEKHSHQINGASGTTAAIAASAQEPFASELQMAPMRSQLGVMAAPLAYVVPETDVQVMDRAPVRSRLGVMAASAADAMPETNVQVMDRAPVGSRLGAMAASAADAMLETNVQVMDRAPVRSRLGAMAAPLVEAALEMDAISFSKSLIRAPPGSTAAVAASSRHATSSAAATLEPTAPHDGCIPTAPRHVPHKRAAASSFVATKAPRSHEWSSQLVSPTRPHLTPAAQCRRDLRLGCLLDQALHLASILENDKSTLALRPQDPEALHQLCLATLQAAESAPADSTTKADDLAWERWCAYCNSMGTPPLRMNGATMGTSHATSMERKTALLCGFLLYLADTISGRGCTGSSKPQSNFQMVLAVRRIHDTWARGWRFYTECAGSTTHCSRTSSQRTAQFLSPWTARGSHASLVCQKAPKSGHER